MTCLKNVYLNNLYSVRLNIFPCYIIPEEMRFHTSMTHPKLRLICDARRKWRKLGKGETGGSRKRFHFYFRYMRTQVLRYIFISRPSRQVILNSANASREPLRHHRYQKTKTMRTTTRMMMRHRNWVFYLTSFFYYLSNFIILFKIDPNEFAKQFEIRRID